MICIIATIKDGQPDWLTWIELTISILTFISSIIGILYVVRTFKNQELINQQQAELNRLSMEKDRRETRPQFYLGDRFYFNREYLEFSLWTRNATAYNVKVRVDGEAKFRSDSLTSFVRECDAEGGLHFIFHPVDLGSDDILYGDSSLFNLEFNDEAGRSYRQEFWLNDYKVVTSLPYYLDTVPPVLIGRSTQ